MTVNNWFEEFNIHLLEDEKPSIYFNGLVEKDSFPRMEPFDVIIELKNIEQNLTHHPEGNVWNHTMEVVDLAAKYRHLSKDEKIFMWAAMLHDLGKIPTTKIRKGRITAYDHDKEGAILAREFLEKVVEDEAFIEKIVGLVRWHMQPMFVHKNLPFAQVDEMVKQTSVSEIGLLGVCDRMGRGPISKKKKEEAIDVSLSFLSKGIKKVQDSEKPEVQNRMEEIKNIKKDFRP